MKKKLLTAMILFPLLTGCNAISGSTSVSTSYGSYTFGDELTSYEKAELIKDIKKSAQSYNGIDIAMEYSTYEKYNQSTTHISGHIVPYSNNYINVTGTQSLEQTKSGITNKISMDFSTHAFIDNLSNTEVQYSTGMTLDGGVSYSINKFEIDQRDDKIEQLYYQYLSQFLSDLSELTARKNGSGFVFYKSNVTEKHSYIEAGAETKDQIDLNEEQKFTFIDSSRRISSIQSKKISSANYDSSTGEWLNSMKALNRETSSVSFSYGDRNSSNKPEELKDMMSDSFFNSATLTFYYSDVNDPETHLGESSVSNLEIIKLSPYEWRLRGYTSIDINTEGKVFGYVLNSYSYTTVTSSTASEKHTDLLLSADDTVIRYKVGTKEYHIVPSDTSGKKIFVDCTVKIKNQVISVSESNLTIG